MNSVEFRAHKNELAQRAQTQMLAQLSLESFNTRNVKAPVGDIGNNKTPPSGLVFVFEWCHDLNYIYGYGCNNNGTARLLKANVRPGLFVVSNEPDTLREVCKLYDGDASLRVYNQIQFKSNNFAVWDLFGSLGAAKYARPLCLIKIETLSIASAMKLYYKFKNDNQAYKYVNVSHYYDATKQMVFELMVRRHKYANEKNCTYNEIIDYQNINCTMVWLDSNLHEYSQYERPVLPIITFDIETVSSDPHRVPTGDEADDVLFTVSVHHANTNTLYTLIYLPLSSADDGEFKTQKNKILDDGYNTLEDETLNCSSNDDNDDNDHISGSKMERILQIFDNEIALLERTMALLTLPRNQLHVLIGYNSMSYDLKYLLTRCTFYRMTRICNHFVWRDGLSYGWSQIHIDMFRVICLRYRFKSYTLDSVCSELIGHKKTGVNSVALRFSFFFMAKNNKIVTRAMSNPTLPSIVDTLHYNNADTLLVSRLEKSTQSIRFYLKHSQQCMVPLSTLATNYNKMQYRLWNECFAVGLRLGLFLSSFKSADATFACPCPTRYHATADRISVNINTVTLLNSGRDSIIESTMPEKITDLQLATYTRSEFELKYNKNFTVDDGTVHISSIENTTSKIHNTRIFALARSMVRSKTPIVKKSTFPGGANFCLGHMECDNVQMYDYVAAYPTLMERCNLSDETVAILPADVLLALCPTLKNRAEYKLYDYMTHSGSRTTETSILYYQYIYDNLYSGQQIAFELSDLRARKKAPIIVVWHGRVGVLSQIVAEFSKMRSNYRISRDILNDAVILVLRTIDEIDESADNRDDGQPKEKKCKIEHGGKTQPNRCVTFAGSRCEYLPEYCSIVNDHLSIDKHLLERHPRKIASLNNLLKRLKLEANTASNAHDLQKSTNSSVYGCAGIQIPVLAAVVTCLTRQTLLKAAKDLVDWNHTVLYIDTDSVFTVAPVHRFDLDMSPQLNEKYPHMQIAMKTAAKCMFVKRKTYFRIDQKCDVETGATIKYGQNVNGPHAWKRCVLYFYNSCKNITTNFQLYSAFFLFFLNCYDTLHKAAATSIRAMQLDIMQTIKVRNDYKSLSVLAKYKQYVNQNYPELSTAIKHEIFYMLSSENVSVAELRPITEIDSMDALRTVNLFKYYQNMFTTIYNIVLFTIKKNNMPYNVTVSQRYVLLLMLKGFLDAHSVTYNNVAIEHYMNTNSFAAESERFHTLNVTIIDEAAASQVGIDADATNYDS